MTTLETRDMIFKWAYENNLYIDFSVTGLVFGAYEKDEKLRSADDILIYRGDADEILRRFDTYNTKLIALGFLCYAKAYANDGGYFNMSFEAFAEWVGIDRSNMINRYLPILKSFEYIDMVQRGARWNDKKTKKSNSYKLLVPLYDSGECVAELEGNDIRGLYEKIF